MKTLTIGRDDSNQIVLKDNYISRHHAELLLYDDGKVGIKDLGSSNGTFVNGVRITQEILKPGDIVKCAGVFLDWQIYAPQGTNTLIKRKLVVPGLIALFFIIGVAVLLLLMHKKPAIIDVSPNVFLLKNYYVYTVELTLPNKPPIEINLIKKPGNVFDLYNSESTPPNVVYANATMIDKGGRCVTSRYAAEPWNNKLDVDNLYKMVLQEANNKVIKALKITGKSIAITVTPWNNINSNNTTSLQYGLSNKPSINFSNIAYIERKEKIGTIQVNNISIANSGNFFKDNKNNKVTLFALPQNIFNPVPNDTFNPVPTEITIGSDSIPSIEVKLVDRLLIEAAPIFDKDGKLLAVNTQARMNLQGKFYNRAVFISP